MKKIILFLITSLLFINCSALSYGGCDYTTVSRMKSIIKNINITYDYKILNNEAYFDVTINNLTNDIYFYDTLTNRNYYYNDTNDGEITIYNYRGTSGSYKFRSNISECYGISLGVKYYNFPEYNRYYADPLCSDIPNFSLCQKWLDVKYSRSEFEQLVSNYKNNDKNIIEEENIVEYEKTIFDRIIEIYINYYYYFLGGLILMCTIIIIINNRKNRFKL